MSNALNLAKESEYNLRLLERIVTCQHAISSGESIYDHVPVEAFEAIAGGKFRRDISHEQLKINADKSSDLDMIFSLMSFELDVLAKLKSLMIR